MGEDTRLSDALTEVLITSYEIESCRPFFFTRRKARAKKTSRFNPRMWEVAALHLGGAHLLFPVSDQAMPAGPTCRR